MNCCPAVFSQIRLYNETKRHSTLNFFSLRHFLGLILLNFLYSRERHPGSFDIVHVKDANGHVFATRLGYIFIIGKGNKPYISLPKGKGVKLTIAEERDKRLGAK